MPSSPEFNQAIRDTSRMMAALFGSDPDVWNKITVAHHDGSWRGVHGWRWGTRLLDHEQQCYVSNCSYRNGQLWRDEFVALWFIGFDDVASPLRPPAGKKDYLREDVILATWGEPDVKIESSPGCYQFMYALETAETRRETATACMKWVSRWARERAYVGSATGSSHAGTGLIARWFRLPGRHRAATNGAAPSFMGRVVSLSDPARPKLTLDAWMGVVFGKTAAEIAGNAVASLSGSEKNPKIAVCVGGAGAARAGISARSENFDHVVAALNDVGWLNGEAKDETVLPSGEASQDGVAGRMWFMTCPWEAEHSPGTGSLTSTYYSDANGAFHCSHDHCSGRRVGDLLLVLDARLEEEGLPTVGERMGGGDPLDPETETALGAATRSPVHELIEDYVLDSFDGRFTSVASRVAQDKRMFETKWTKRLAHVLEYETKTPTGRPAKRLQSLTEWFERQPGARVVDGHGRKPGDKRVVVNVTIDGAELRLFNHWRDRIEAAVNGLPSVSDADVQPWLDLALYVFDVAGIADPRVAPALDWLAGVVGAPSVKAGWAPYLSGDAGTGKNLLVWPLEEAFGPGVSARIKPSDLAKDFNTYLEARLLIVSEMRETTQGVLSPHDVYSHMKDIVDASAGWALINPKFQPKRWVWSTTCMWLVSNNANTMPVDARERRLGYYRVEVPPKDKSYFAGWLVPWLRDGNGFDPTPGWRLVVKWLRQRWETMDQARRDAFAGTAPATPEKDTMVEVAGSPVKELLGAILAEDIEDASTYVQDIADINEVRAGLDRAIETNRHGVSKGTRVPSNHLLADWLREFGAERFGYDPAARIHRQTRLGVQRKRLWIVRRLSTYRILGNQEIRAQWFLQRGMTALDEDGKPISTQLCVLKPNK